MDIIVDIDGTIADNAHRQSVLDTEPKDWNAFFAGCMDDLPIWPILLLIESFCGGNVLLVTGRSERYRALTISWLEKYIINFHELYMRKEGDFRPDHIVKEEILINQIRPKYDPELAIDDRQCVVDMWRRNGLICLQNEPKII